MRLLTEAYRRAENVLVLDDGIMTQCHVGEPVDEILFRIMTSYWMQDVWTLTAYISAKNFYFSVSDGVVSSRQLRKQFDKRTTRPQGKVLRQLDPISSQVLLLVPLDYPIRDIYARTFPAESSPLKFPLETVMRHLRRRTPSDPMDEALVISILTGIDAALMLSQSTPKERMKTLLLRLETLPTSLMFHLDVPRYHENPFRWAPQTLCLSSSFDYHSGGLAACSRNGLLSELTLPVLRFPAVHVSEGMDLLTIELFPFDSNSIYTVSGMSKYARDASFTGGTINGLVIALNAGQGGKDPIQDHPTMTPAAAVRINEPDRTDRGIRGEVVEASAPTLCEYAFPLEISKQTARLPGSKHSEHLSRCYVEGYYLLTKLIIT